MIDWQKLRRIDAIRYYPESWQKISWIEAIRTAPLNVGLIVSSPEIPVAEYAEKHHWCFGWPFYPDYLENGKPHPPSG